MKNKFFLFLFSFLLCACQTYPTSTSISSLSDAEFKEEAFLLSEKENSYLKPISLMNSVADEGKVALSFFPEQRKQEVDLFGGALTHSSAHQILKIKDEEKRKEFLKDIFLTNGFNCLRIPIGSSDFHSEEHFFTCLDSFSDASDPLKDFTLEHDRELIQVLEEVLAIRMDLRIIAAPWSAPAFMKKDSKVSSKDINGPKLCGGYLKDEFLSLYSDYLALFVEKYQELGIPIHYLSLQNEATFNSADYPCMILTPIQAKRIAKRLSSILPESTKLLAYDHNVEETLYDYLKKEFQDEETMSSFDSIGIHGYGKEPLPEGTKKLSELYPDKKIYMNEITEWDSGSTFSENLMYMAKNTTQEAINSGLSGTIYWNLCLDQNGGPCMGQYSTCYGLLDLSENEDGTIKIQKRSGFYGLSIFSRILHCSEKNHVYRLETSQSDSSLLFSAFEEKEGYGFVITNPTNKKIPFSLSYQKKEYSYELEATSMIGFTIQKNSAKIES